MGFGFSDKPQGADYSIERQADIVARLIAHLGIGKVVLIGHSMGGGIALLTYFRLVDANSAGTVNGLVLIDSAGYLQDLPFFVRYSGNIVASTALTLIPADVRVRTVLRRIFFVTTQVTDDRVYRYSYFLRAPGATRALRESARRLVPNNAPAIIRRISSVAVPTLVVWGRNDPIISVELGKRFQREITGAQLTVLADTGHVPHEERPALVAHAIRDFIEAL
jgi:pimeloyl-ACP methyl ester carboxylesterase